VECGVIVAVDTRHRSIEAPIRRSAETTTPYQSSDAWQGQSFVLYDPEGAPYRLFFPASSTWSAYFALPFSLFFLLFSLPF
jgi:hypothetical protein